MKDKTRQYSNGEVTVTWNPDACIHSTNCWKQLGSVFNPRIRPWIKMDGATSTTIIEQVKKCPSGALKYFMNSDSAVAVVQPKPEPELKITITENGPYLVQSPCILVHPDGTEEVKKDSVALCRCGASRNKPFCDGSHLRQKI